jgi:site-specific recombinase XerD
LIEDRQKKGEIGKGEMGTRNFGLGSRNMDVAGRFALEREMESFKSIDTMAERWGQFCDWAKEEGIKKMEQIEQSDLVRYGTELASRVERGEMAASTAQNYVSACNRVLEIARGDKKIWVSPTKDCNIPERGGIATTNKATSEESHQAAKELVSERIGALLDVQRELGLRFEESAKLNAVGALAQARETGLVSIQDGTKGGRARQVPITSKRQLAALQRASRVQEQDRSMIPAKESYAAFQRQAYREAADAGVRFHGEGVCSRNGKNRTLSQFDLNCGLQRSPV